MSEPPPPPTQPAIQPPTQPPAHNGRRYLLGLGLGFVPVLLAIISGVFSYPLFTYNASGPYDPGLSNGLLSGAAILYGIAIIAMIVCLFNKEVRFIGYGLLTMVLIGPIVAVVGCSVISSATHPLA